MRQEGRGIGLYRKLEAYRLQELGQDTFSANRILRHGEDERDYAATADMLRALGLSRITLLSNNPDKRSQLEGLGIAVAAVRATGVLAGRHNLRYLEAKVRQAGHTIDLATVQADCSVRRTSVCVAIAGLMGAALGQVASGSRALELMLIATSACPRLASAPIQTTNLVRGLYR